MLGEFIRLLCILMFSADYLEAYFRFYLTNAVFSCSHNLKLREHIIRWLVRELFELPVDFSEELSERLGQHDHGFMRRSRARLWEDEDFEKPNPKETWTLIKQELPPYGVPPDKEEGGLFEQNLDFLGQELSLTETEMSCPLITVPQNS